jgi:hypothetical protein
MAVFVVVVGIFIRVLNFVRVMRHSNI